MSPTDWASRPLKLYAQFSGRAGKSEFWWYSLFLFLAYVVLLGAAAAFAAAFGNGGAVLPEIVIVLLVLGAFIPSLAVAIRRLHDIGKNGWWYLIILVPAIGPLILLIFHIMDSEPGTNRYGPNPSESLLSSAVTPY